jgi:hypothetical protein
MKIINNPYVGHWFVTDVLYGLYEYFTIVLDLKEWELQKQRFLLGKWK